MQIHPVMLTVDNHFAEKANDKDEHVAVYYWDLATYFLKLILSVLGFGNILEVPES